MADTQSPTPTQDGGTPLSTVNETATDIDKGISVAETVAEKAVDVAAESAQTWLAFPVVKQLFEALVSWIVGVLGKTGQLFATKAVTTIQGNNEDSALLKAEQEVQDAITSGDTARIAQAEADFQKAQSAAVNTDGSAHPQ